VTGRSIPRHSCIGRTLSLTIASVSTDSSCLVQCSGPGSGVHGDRLADDEAICDKFADGLAGVGIGDFVDFIRIEPNLTLATANDGRRQALLSSKVDPAERFSLVAVVQWL
jgi:hypothetical protein